MYFFTSFSIPNSVYILLCPFQELFFFPFSFMCYIFSYMWGFLWSASKNHTNSTNASGNVNTSTPKRTGCVWAFILSPLYPTGNYIESTRSPGFRETSWLKNIFLFPSPNDINMIKPKSGGKCPRKKKKNWCIILSSKQVPQTLQVNAESLSVTPPTLYFL